MTTFLMVDVESVTSSVLRSNFLETDLDILADMILKCGGILKPLVLKKTGFDRYEVVDGHFEYYAAVRAREKNPSEGEMVNALIVSPEEEEAVLKQSEALREWELSGKQVKPPSDTKNLESRLTSIELRFEKQINELRSEQAQERQRLENKLNKIQSQTQKQITPIEAFNTLSLSELILRLRSAGLTDNKAAQIVKIIESERKKQKFNSLSDVVLRVKVKQGKKQVKGISSNKMVDIIDSWSHLSFS